MIRVATNTCTPKMRRMQIREIYVYVCKYVYYTETYTYANRVLYVYVCKYAYYTYTYANTRIIRICIRIRNTPEEP
jgi:hypothetical protein